MDKLAINGGKKYKTGPFPVWPVSDDRELELVQEVVRSRKWWRMSGTKVEEFEQKFARFHNVTHCLGVTNGTHAIELILSALDIGVGDEVIVPAFTFISTATAPIYCNATPVPVDIDPETFCMDIQSFERAITPRTKAVMPVHMAGHVCNMDEINRVALKHNLLVIEDAAHAHGAEWKKNKVGTFSDAAIFSFQNGKLMTCGEGGAILTNNTKLYEKLFLMHGVGRPKNDKIYKHIVLGSNYRMNEFLAAVLIAQLERLEAFSAKREKNAAVLDGLLNAIEGIVPQGRDASVTLNPHYMYMFYYDKNHFNGLARNTFVEYLCAEGIPAFIAYPAVCDTDFFTRKEFNKRIQYDYNIREFDIPNARRVADEVVWLPHYCLLGDEDDLADIAGAITKIRSNMRI